MGLWGGWVGYKWVNWVTRCLGEGLDLGNRVSGGLILGLLKLNI